jgi:hypothetical protein
MPTAKKKLNRKSIAEATIPELLFPFETVPARTDMQQHIPVQANNMSLRRPNLSRIQIGGSDETKYATPLKPASKRDRFWDSPTDRTKMEGA